MFGRFWKRDEKRGAAREPRPFAPDGSVQSLGYRFVHPEEIVDDVRAATVSPGGSPEDPLDAQRRVS